MALSNAERQRRYIARLKEKAAVTNDGVTNEFMRLKAFVGQLERENATLKEKLAAAKRREDDLLKEVSKLKVDSRFAPKGAMTATQFAAIRKCLHPDTVHRLGDEDLTKRFNEAFRTLNGLKSQLVR